eukprot:991020-Amphidinium_carterae.1
MPKINEACHSFALDRINWEPGGVLNPVDGLCLLWILYFKVQGYVVSSENHNLTVQMPWGAAQSFPFISLRKPRRLVSAERNTWCWDASDTHTHTDTCARARPSCGRQRVPHSSLAIFFTFGVTLVYSWWLQTCEHAGMRWCSAVGKRGAQWPCLRLGPLHDTNPKKGQTPASCADIAQYWLKRMDILRVQAGVLKLRCPWHGRLLLVFAHRVCSLTNQPNTRQQSGYVTRACGQCRSAMTCYSVQCYCNHVWRLRPHSLCHRLDIIAAQQWTRERSWLSKPIPQELSGIYDEDGYKVSQQYNKDSSICTAPSLSDDQGDATRHVRGNVSWEGFFSRPQKPFER